jgi:hypothetical protein
MARIPPQKSADWIRILSRAKAELRRKGGISGTSLVVCASPKLESQVCCAILSEIFGPRLAITTAPASKMPTRGLRIYPTNMDQENSMILEALLRGKTPRSGKTVIVPKGALRLFTSISFKDMAKIGKFLGIQPVPFHKHPLLAELERKHPSASFAAAKTFAALNTQGAFFRKTGQKSGKFPEKQAQR